MKIIYFLIFPNTTYYTPYSSSIFIIINTAPGLGQTENDFPIHTVWPEGLIDIGEFGKFVLKFSVDLIQLRQNRGKIDITEHDQWRRREQARGDHW